MRCPICNADTDAPDVCGECTTAIIDCVQTYEDIEESEDDDAIIQDVEEPFRPPEWWDEDTDE